MQLESEIELALRTSLRVGGRASWFVEARSELELLEALEFAERRALRVWILGGGSNVVVPDSGLRGLVIAVTSTGIDHSGDGRTLWVKAGESWDGFVEYAVECGLQGVECLSGIPGLVGATPIQNVGAYGQDVSESIVEVRAFDRRERSFVQLSAAECGFGYRDSRFKSKEPQRFIVTAVRFALAATGRPKLAYPELVRALEGSPDAGTLQGVRRAVLALRRNKSMLQDQRDENGRSCGSFFVNPSVPATFAAEVERRLGATNMPKYPQTDGSTKLSAAWLIEQSGFVKGQRSGNVGISSRHALALVCHAGATSAELLKFAEQVREGVLARSGVALTPEPVIW